MFLRNRRAFYRVEPRTSLGLTTVTARANIGGSWIQADLFDASAAGMGLRFIDRSLDIQAGESLQIELRDPTTAWRAIADVHVQRVDITEEGIKAGVSFVNTHHFYEQVDPRIHTLFNRRGVRRAQLTEEGYPAVGVVGEQRLEGFCRDLSVRGAGIELNNPPPIDDHSPIHVTIVFPQRGPLTFEACVHNTWEEDNAVRWGIEFSPDGTSNWAKKQWILSAALSELDEPENRREPS